MAIYSQKTYRVNQPNSMSYTEIQADFARKFSLESAVARRETRVQETVPVACRPRARADPPYGLCQTQFAVETIWTPGRYSVT